MQPDSHLVCFSLRGLPERMRAPALMLTLDAIWRSLEGPLRRRVVLVDEAWDSMRETPSAHARRPAHASCSGSRRRPASAGPGSPRSPRTPATCSDSPLGQAVVANASQHFLLHQSPQAIDRVGQAFALTAGERSYLFTCPAGHGLLLTGEQRIPLRVKASPAEHELVTSDPAELAEAA